MRTGCRGVLLIALAGALTLMHGAARAQPGWRQGVFPVVNFAGYTSHFGLRLGPGGGLESHAGLDIAAPLGSPIRSWWSGSVRDVIQDRGCGVGLVIASGPYEHIYCHLAGQVSGGVYRSGTVALAPGSTVRGGQLIGHVGLSGRSTGPHLHWAIRHGGQWLDPAGILRAMAAARSR